MGKYDDAFQRSVNDPEGFWLDVAAGIDWYRTPTVALDRSTLPFHRWFPDGEMNTCHNAVDRHVHAGNGARTALIFDSPVTGVVRKVSYYELRTLTAKVGGMLRNLGVEKGDRVLLYMPNSIEAIAAMLGCARIGAVHSVVFGGFAPAELATRIDDAKPVVILAASCGIEGSKVIAYKPLLDEALSISSHQPHRVVVNQRAECRAALNPGRDVDWALSMAASNAVPCVPVKSTDPLYILYTSGTTGQPKGIVRDNGGHAVALNWTMRNFYDIQPGDVFWAASDVGWVVGHSYICYAPLIAGCTSVVYEGKPVGTPNPGAFFRVIAQHGVRALFTAPTAFRAIRRDDPSGEWLRKYDLDSLETLFLAGERSDPDTIRWAEDHLKIPVIDHYWQTETGWCIVGNPRGTELFPTKYGSACKPQPGWNVKILDAELNELPRGDIGSIVVQLPLPPGAATTIWNGDERFQATYFADFPGYYETKDAGFIDDDGYVSVMTRTDDVINVAGHRLSTGQFEEVIAAHPDVAECAAIGVADTLKGQVPLGFLVLKAGVSRPHEDIVKEVVALVREKVGPVADFKKALVVARLPKTRSGKVVRKTMAHIADCNEYKVPATIDDASILGEIEQALKTIGYAG